MSDNTETTQQAPENAQENEAPAKEDQLKAKPDQQKPKVDTNPDSLYREKIEGLNSDLHGVRQKLKAISAERDRFKSEVESYQLKEAKTVAFNEGLSNLGEDFEIPTEKLPELHKVIEALPASDTLSETINSLISAAKTPKAKQQQPQSSPFFGNAPQANQQSGTMSEADKLKMARENPEEFKKLFVASPFSNSK